MKESEQIPRILVLTSATGGGHNARAWAFESWVRELHGEKAEVRIEEILEGSSPLINFGVSFYNLIQRKAPILHNLYWWGAEVFMLLNARLTLFGYSHFRRILLDFEPDTVFSVHDSTNRGYFRVARRVMPGREIKCATYCGEFSGGSGFSRNWVDKEVDLFYARTDETASFAAKLGIPKEKTRILGNLLPPEVFGSSLNEGQRAEFRSRVLDLDGDRFTVFLAAAGSGANHHRRCLEVLKDLSAYLQVIVICGKDEGLYHSLEGWQQSNPGLRVFLEGFSTQVPKLIEVSNAVVTRPGSNTSAEALYFGCPIIFNGMGGLMPQERLTLRYFLKHRAAELIKNEREFEEIVRRWVDFSGDYLEYRNNILSLRKDDSPEAMVRELTGPPRRIDGNPST